MTGSLSRSAVWSLLLGLLAFALDRVHKFVQLEIAGWRGGEFVEVTGFFDYVLVWNTGISYGLFGDLPVALLSLLAVALIAIMLVWWWRTSDVLVRFGLMSCVGGAASNLLDRMIYGAVADFFHFHWQDYSFYIFNIADAAITLGVLLLVLDLTGIGRRKPASGG